DGRPAPGGDHADPADRLPVRPGAGAGRGGGGGPGRGAGGVAAARRWHVPAHRPAGAAARSRGGRPAAHRRREVPRQRGGADRPGRGVRDPRRPAGRPAHPGHTGGPGRPRRPGGSGRPGRPWCGASRPERAAGRARRRDRGLRPDGRVVGGVAADHARGAGGAHLAEWIRQEHPAGTAAGVRGAGRGPGGGRRGGARRRRPRGVAPRPGLGAAAAPPVRRHAGRQHPAGCPGRHRGGGTGGGVRGGAGRGRRRASGRAGHGARRAGVRAVQRAAAAGGAGPGVPAGRPGGAAGRAHRAAGRGERGGGVRGDRAPGGGADHAPGGPPAGAAVAGRPGGAPGRRQGRRRRAHRRPDTAGGSGPGRGGGGATVRAVLAVARPYLWRLVGAGALAVAADLAGLALMATATWLLVTAAGQPPLAALTVAIVSVRALAVGRGGLRYAERLTGHDAVLRVLAEVRARMFAALVESGPPGRVDGRARGRTGAPARSGDLLSRLVSDVEAVQDLLLRVLVPGAAAAVVGAAVVAGAAVLAPPAAPVLAAALLATGVLLPAVAARTARRSAELVAPLRAAVATDAVDLTRGAADLAAFGATARATAQARARAARLARVESRLAAAGVASDATGTLLGGVAAAWMVVVGVRTGIDG